MTSVTFMMTIISNFLIKISIKSFSCLVSTKDFRFNSFSSNLKLNKETYLNREIIFAKPQIDFPIINAGLECKNNTRVKSTTITYCHLYFAKVLIKRF